MNAAQPMLYTLTHPRQDTDPPDAVGDLRAEALAGGRVKLTWTAPRDAVRYRVKYAAHQMVPNLNFDKQTRRFEFGPAGHANWWAGKNVSGEPAPGGAGSTETFTAPDIAPGAHYFALRSHDRAGNRSAISNQVKVEIR
jgi:hypothetical protein